MIVKWLLDTGASIHAKKNLNGITGEKACTTIINIADGSKELHA
jgi:hypothetical protein